MSQRRLLTPRVTALAALAFAAPAQAHSGETGAWFDDGLLDLLIATPCLLYALGLARLIRGGRPGAWQPLPRWRILAFVLAMATLAIALVSPFDGLADRSFAWHMAQHLLLMSVAAPLLAASNAHLVLLRAFPIPARRGVGRMIGAIPGVRRGGHAAAAAWLAFAAFSVGLWLWHAPGMYDLALRHEDIHTLEHITFLLTSIAFWRVIGTSGGRRLSIGMGVLMVSLVGLEGALLAALITLAPRPLYAVYAGHADALSDQVAAGVLMWVPASLLYLASSVLALRRLFAGQAQGRQSPAL